MSSWLWLQGKRGECDLQSWPDANGKYRTNHRPLLLVEKFLRRSIKRKLFNMTKPRPPKRQKTSSSALLPESINNFTLLPITLPSSVPSVPSATHILYLRRHEQPPQPPALISTEPSRTIFVVNVPVDSTKEILRGLFASLGGRSENVEFHGQNNDEAIHTENLSLPEIWDRRLCPTGSTAHITFPTSDEVDKIFRTILKERRNQGGAIREWGVGVDNATSSLGLQRSESLFQTNYRIPKSL
jgi:Rrp7 RRM-like N-terminal domain